MTHTTAPTLQERADYWLEHNDQPHDWGDTITWELIKEQRDRLEQLEHALTEWAAAGLRADTWNPDSVPTWKRAHNKLRRLAGAPVLFPEVDQP